MSPKFRLTEEAIEILVASNIDPEVYGATQTQEGGIPLFNAGAETTVLGRTKFVAFEEKNVGFKTGIKIALSPGDLAMVVPVPGILQTSLTAPVLTFGPNYTGEILISLSNMGEKDVVFKKGNPLPVQLIFISGVQKPELVSDLEYLKTSSNLNTD